MDKLAIGKFATLAFLAALIGSVLGTGVYIADHFYGHPDVMPRPVLFDLLFYLPFSFMSLVGTIPGAYVVGCPVIYPFRHIIARHPLLSCAPVVFVSLVLSFAVLGWAFRQQGGGHYTDLEILWSYSGSTAFGFVVALGRWGKRHPALIGSPQPAATPPA